MFNHGLCALVRGGGYGKIAFWLPVHANTVSLHEICMAWIIWFQMNCFYLNRFGNFSGDKIGPAAGIPEGAS